METPLATKTVSTNKELPTQMVITKKVREEPPRRSDDLARISKLEYVVYENHEPRITNNEKQTDENTQTSREIVLNLRSIKRIAYAFAIGYTMSQVGVDKALELLSKLI